MEFGTGAIIAICFSALLIGFSRTAIPGFGTLVPIVLALVMPVKESTGFLLPILVVAGELAGILLVKKIPQKAFNTIAQALAALAGIKLFF